MKILLRTALAALSIASINPAFAGDRAANGRSTEIPGVAAQARALNAPTVGIAQNGKVVVAYVISSQHGTWLFPSNPNQGANG